MSGFKAAEEAGIYLLEIGNKHIPVAVELFVTVNDIKYPKAQIALPLESSRLVVWF